jgi:hypothetical protein
LNGRDSIGGADLGGGAAVPGFPREPSQRVDPGAGRLLDEVSHPLGRLAYRHGVEKARKVAIVVERNEISSDLRDAVFER